MFKILNGDTKVTLIQTTASKAVSSSPIASNYCSTEISELTKVSISSAIVRMQSRKDRKKWKKISNSQGDVTREKSQ